MNLINSAKWVAFSQFFKVIVQLVNIVYLARLIPLVNMVLWPWLWL